MAINIDTVSSLTEYTKTEWESTTDVTFNPANTNDHYYFISVLRDFCFPNVTTLAIKDSAKRDLTGYDYAPSDLYHLPYIFPNVQNLTVTIVSTEFSPLATLIGYGSTSAILKPELLDLDYLVGLFYLSNLTFVIDTITPSTIRGIGQLYYTGLTSLHFSSIGADTYFSLEVPGLDLESALLYPNSSLTELTIEGCSIYGNQEYLLVYQGLTDLTISSAGTFNDISFLGDLPNLTNLTLLDNIYTDFVGAIQPSLRYLTIMSNATLSYDALETATYLTLLEIRGTVAQTELDNLDLWGIPYTLNGATVV
jgi:hypothetical protein